MERIEELEFLTKDYFIESHEFLFSKKFANTKKKQINLIFGAYNLEYNLILKDYKIFFDNKLKTKFKLNTTIVRDKQAKNYNLSKYFYFSKKLVYDKFFTKNFNLKDITIKPNVLITWRLFRRRHTMLIRRLKLKRLNRKFFYKSILEIL